jgi:acylphosphatase
MLKQLHAYYSGSVQGVGFRFTAQALAAKFKVKGWVKNLADGRVEVVAEAEEETLKQFESALSQEMSVYLTSKSVNFEPAAGNFSGFNVRF